MSEANNSSHAVAGNHTTATQAPTHVQSQSLPPGLRVLVVDDSDMNRKVGS